MIKVRKLTKSQSDMIKQQAKLVGKSFVWIIRKYGFNPATFYTWLEGNNTGKSQNQYIAFRHAVKQELGVEI